MKQLLLFCAGLCLSLFVQAQTARFDNNKSIALDPPVKMKVTLNTDKMLIVYENHEIPGASVQVLDSLMKKVPDLKNIKIEFDDINADPEKKKAINAVLNKCQCRIARHSLSMQKFD